jgi:hypothetical protein
MSAYVRTHGYDPRGPGGDERWNPRESGRREQEMCRPDDFPPYPDADVAEKAHAVLVQQRVFRDLDPEEERLFRSWARENFTPGAPLNPLWHPVVRDECERMNAEKGEEQ